MSDHGEVTPNAGAKLKREAGAKTSALAVGAITAYVKGQLAEPEPTTYIAALLQAAIHTADEVI
jgi:hypothetical protein